MSFVEMMKRIDRDYIEAHRKLKGICSQSERINYDDLIKRLVEVVGDIAGYKFDFFVNLLAEELEHSFIVNRNAWDLTIEEIENKYKNDMDYWKGVFMSESEFEDCYGTVENFKDSMIDWMITYSLDGAFASVECEYKYRKSVGFMK